MMNKTNPKAIHICNSHEPKLDQKLQKLEQETVWLSQKQMAELFDKNSDTSWTAFTKYL